MKEYKINDYISLKLEKHEDEEGYETVIYVNDEKFMQCTKVAINIPLEESVDYDDINSIDELIQRKNNKAVEIISPEEEFMVHCSNLRAWVENNYNTNLLHSNLSFPLLKKLTEVGDKKARNVFKEEISKRLQSGYFPVIRYLINEGYDEYLTREEFYLSLMGWNSEAYESSHALITIEKLLDYKLNLASEINSETNRIVIKNNKLIGLSLHAWNLEKFPDEICKLESLEKLYLCFNKINSIPTSIESLKNLKMLHLGSNKLKELPHEIGKLKNLEVLYLSDNFFSSFPKILVELKSLKELFLSFNQLEYIPESIRSLRNLEFLDLEENRLKRLPKTIEELDSLRIIKLNSNLDFMITNKQKEKLENKGIKIIL